MQTTLDAKLALLTSMLRENSPLLVAFSGGVDSAFLLAFARQTLGDQVRGVIADSPSLPRAALQRAISLAREWDVTLEIIATREMEQEDYTSNPINRCYFCKAELFRKMETHARESGMPFLAYGENADDASQVRPGRLAAEEFAILAPLKQAGLTKAEIREVSRTLHLATADDPAQPCLSSRIPHGVRVTSEVLLKIEQAEEYTRSLGFRVFRVRHLASDQARIQIAPEEMPLPAGVEQRLLGGIRALGYATVEIDPAGYRSPA